MTRPTPLSVIFLLGLGTQVLLPVSANYDLQVRVHSYRNPTHRISNGNCCNNYETFTDTCTWSCVNILHFCLGPVRIDLTTVNCSLGGVVTTAAIEDYTEFVGSSVGGIHNPITFESINQNWTDTIWLLIQIRHNGLGYKDVVDNILLTLPQFDVNGTFTDRHIWSSLSVTRSQIALSFDGTCSANFYGPDCSVHCSPTQRYGCNKNGQRICNENYYNLPNCSTQCTPSHDHNCDTRGNKICSRDFFIPPSCSEECVPRDDLIGHYKCLLNGSRICLDGYYGDDCTVTCEAEMGRSSCDENGTLVCEDGYYGDNCSVYCAPRNDGGGHYDCDNTTGLIVCLKGFEDPTRNCTQQVCNPPCNSAGGRCANEGAGFMCKCLKGWRGDQCLECTLLEDNICLNAVNACQSMNPCLNGGECVATLFDDSSSDTQTTTLLFCKCPEGYIGSLCESEVVTRTRTGDTTPAVAEGTSPTVAEGTAGPSGSAPITAVVVVIVMLVLVISVTLLAVVIAMYVRRRNRLKQQPNNGSLTVGMLDNGQSLREGIHNACYVPQAIGVCHGRSNSTGSDVHKFDNPLYLSYDHDSQSHDQYNQSHDSGNYSYPVFTRNAMNRSRIESVHSDSSLYSSLINQPVQLTQPDRPQTVARDNYENVDFDYHT